MKKRTLLTALLVIPMGIALAKSKPVSYEYEPEEEFDPTAFRVRPEQPTKQPEQPTKPSTTSSQSTEKAPAGNS